MQHCWSGQAIAFVVDHGVEFVSALFEDAAVADADAAALVVDESCVMQVASDIGGAFAAHAWHVGDLFPLARNELPGSRGEDYRRMIGLPAWRVFTPDQAGWLAHC